MRALLGLGNPGAQYAATRHNVGFRVVELLARGHGLRLRAPLLQPLRLAQGQIRGQPVVLAQPLTYMNNSGAAARRLLQRFSLKPADLLVIYDDLDLELGRVRLRGRGSPGTHNGMRSLVAELGTQDLPRLRLGTGPLPERTSARSFVLAPFTAEQALEVEAMLNRAAEAAECWLREGVETTMNRYNE